MYCPLCIGQTISYVEINFNKLNPGIILNSQIKNGSKNQKD